MAVLGKIRSKGTILIVIIGLGIFSFIAEEFFRSCESSRNNDRQQIGEVLGEKIDVNQYQKMVDEYAEVIKMQQGVENLNDEQLNQVKDMVWNTYIQTKLVEDDAKKLGLTVTDQEMVNVLNEGTNPMLMQTPFVNQQTGRFDANALKKFLADYNTQKNTNPALAQQYERIFKYWTFIEKTLRQQLLAQKYQSLFAHCLLSNPIEAKMAFNDENVESQIQLATFPYTNIDDSKVTITDADLKAKYEELKPRFKQYVETRDIKYVDFQVTASKADRANLQKLFAGYAKDLAAATDPAAIVRKSSSSVNYLGIPVSKNAFPMDIAAKLDSMSVGQTLGPVENKMDNTFNIVKLVSKQQLPDSIQYRQIQVMGKDMADAKQKADSIYNALNGGADFSAVAKKYGQTGDQIWLTTNQYENAPSLDTDSRELLNTLNTGAVNEYKVLKLSQGYVVLQINNRKAMVNKYVAAVIKKPIEFSKETYNAAYNKFASFVSANQTAAGISKNANNSGFQVQELPNVTTSQHYLANIKSTREALKWLFAAKEGEVSPMYECGDNDHLLVVVLNKINPIGYRSLDNEDVKSMVRAEVMKDKKAQMLMEQTKGVNSIAAAKAKGAKVAPVNQITFSAPVFIAATGASEPALSGAVSATAKGKFSTTPVKGNAAIYYFQVSNRTQRPGKFNANEEESKLRQKYMQIAGAAMNELYIKAHVVDNRYLYF